MKKYICLFIHSWTKWTVFNKVFTYQKRECLVCGKTEIERI